MSEHEEFKQQDPNMLAADLLAMLVTEAAQNDGVTHVLTSMLDNRTGLEFNVLLHIEIEAIQPIVKDPDGDDDEPVTH